MDIMQGLLLITTIHLLAAMSPGPDFVLASQQTLVNGKKAGFLVSFGITLGLSIHILYSGLGLAAVIANSVTALWAIKILGGGYLLYLGWKGIRAKASTEELVKGPVVQHSALKSIGVGFLCNALNPKAPIYFVSLFTVVLSPNIGFLELAIYGAWMMIIQMGWFSVIVMLLSSPPIYRRFKAASHWVDRVMGAAMIGLGLKVIMTR